MKSITKNIVLSAMFLAIGLILPFFTVQIPQIGQMLLPMHIPVLLCGFVCGWQSGAIVGFVLPLLRSAIFGMPVFFPSATGMAFELMTYGLVAGLLYSLSKWKCLLALYRSLVIAMLARARGVGPRADHPAGVSRCICSSLGHLLTPFPALSPSLC
ncbi:ECF transporter S component [Acutalibacter sp. 1XD8-33]|uniref:ECF transporter S component n=1 Tax=Acutalibacter sp. 1XD8-33 TaxID=2320081 RepID=UPI0026D119BF